MEYEDSEQGQCLRERPEKKAKETSHGADTDRIRGGECETQEGMEGARNLGDGREYEHSERKENRGKDPGKESMRPATEQKDEMRGTASTSERRVGENNVPRAEMKRAIDLGTPQHSSELRRLRTHPQIHGAWEMGDGGAMGAEL